MLICKPIEEIISDNLIDAAGDMCIRVLFTDGSIAVVKDSDVDYDNWCVHFSSKSGNR